MSRKVYVEMSLRVCLNIDEGISVNRVLETLDLTLDTNAADIEDVEILNSEVIDSK